MTDREYITKLQDECDKMRSERDAARAEVAAMRERVKTLEDAGLLLAGKVRRFLSWCHGKSPYTQEYCRDQVWLSVARWDAALTAIPFPSEPATPRCKCGSSVWNSSGKLGARCAVCDADLPRKSISENGGADDNDAD